jgi:hypothetical protein
MREYGVRRAHRGDLERLAELCGRSLRAECRRDPLLVPGGGEWHPFLKQLLRARSALLLVLEVEGTVEGYALAFQQVVRGPVARPSRWRRLLGRPRPRPLLAPFRTVWVEDIYLTREARRGDGGRALARGVRKWAIHLQATRIGGSVSEGNTPAEAFARALTMRPLRRVWAVDIDPARCPEVPSHGEPAIS